MSSSSSTNCCRTEGECGARCTNPGAKQTHCSKGSLIEYAGRKCYRTGSSKDKAVLYVTDIFGCDFINHQKTADAIASAGFSVFVPNLFQDAMSPVNPDFSKFGEWLSRNSIADAIKVVEATVSQLVSDGFSSIQATGYCYGAKPVVHLLQSNTHIKGAVISHPSFLVRGDGEKIRKGVSLLTNCAASDNIYVPELRADFEAGCKSAGVNLVIIDYPDTEHGFAARPKDASEHSTKMFSEATQNTVKFLTAHA